ncbi:MULTISPECIES: aldose epimerase family protein [unclassified Bradyrhizobium]|uniref:aldose epimerase family protein n=1 Tax=unclassified Bradyrhizobium TaxID=2631580 RepID=UPI0024788294|nr:MULTISPECIES: aldose epimerase family protein [unclassified Bradyrhizobium]WGS19619.1 galactose mutarotase [Bradyrhizobium sp. ISRA463]WGS26463.1 galactose mutarotase [Bradyrhizobium sp. ISRA464]
MTSATIDRAPFGRLPDGSLVERVTLRGADGFEAAILPFGATLQSLMTPDRDGHCDDIVLGHDEFGGYLAQRKFFGATVGRYANRIAGARFMLDGKTVVLDANNGPNALHGGLEGFDRKLWEIVELTDNPEQTLVLARTSPHGEEGYPGNLQTRVTYRVRGPTELSVTFEATTDRPTLLNLTNHSFFNLEGARAGMPILDHRLMIDADHFLAVDPTAIPLPEPPRPVDGTPFDFRKPMAIGARIRINDEQLRLGRGYDHNYCLTPGTGVRLAARLEAPGSGRAMELFTDQPGLQFYSGNFLDGSTAGKGNRLYRQSDALCLEPHAWPDTPNRPDFPSARLDPGQIYRRSIIYRFSTL